MKFHIIVAMDENQGIGVNGKLPWHLSQDLKYFKKVTSTTKDPNKKNAVIMGRVTWESIPDKFRPLPNRLNIILSRNADYMVESGIELVTSLDEALALAENQNIENAFIIGGAQIFNLTLDHPDCARLYITEILQSFNCDTFLSDINKSKFKRVCESEIIEEDGIPFRFVEYKAV